MTQQQKAKRSSNFSKSEEDKLIRLVLEKKHIFENKKTDAISSKNKEASWEELAQRFNASSSNDWVRTPKVLREKYNNIKRLVRKANLDKERQKEQTKIIEDDDDYPPNKRIKKNLLDELSEVICSSVDGMESRFSAGDTLGEDQTYDQIDYKEEEVESLDGYADENGEASERPNDSYRQAEGMIDLQMDKEINHLPNKWHTLQSERIDLSENWEPQKTKKNSSNITMLKEKILEQQLHYASMQHQQQLQFARIEHEQRILHSLEEHKMKIKILEAELRAKKTKD